MSKQNPLFNVATPEGGSVRFVETVAIATAYYKLDQIEEKCPVDGEEYRLLLLIDEIVTLPTEGRNFRRISIPNGLGIFFALGDKDMEKPLFKFDLIQRDRGDDGHRSSPTLNEIALNQLGIEEISEELAHKAFKEHFPGCSIAMVYGYSNSDKSKDFPTIATSYRGQGSVTGSVKLLGTHKDFSYEASVEGTQRNEDRRNSFLMARASGGTTDEGVELFDEVSGVDY